jgi:cell division transport system permease protein
MRQLRILKAVIVETWLGFKQSGWSNWLVISILAIALTIFGGILQLTISLQNLVSSWGSQLEVSVYLKDGFDPKVVADEIKQMPAVQSVEIVPKDIAWQEMKRSLRVAAIENPLPNTLHIKVLASNKVEDIASRIKLLGPVENVRFPLQVTRRLNQVRQFLQIAGLALTTALTMATLTVIGNTIHLVIEARQREIEILSLMGVSPFYIKSPLILQGAAYGAVSAALAIAFLWGVHIYLDSCVSGQLLGIAPILATGLKVSMFNIFTILILLGMAVGASGSWWTSGRYMKL